MIFLAAGAIVFFTMRKSKKKDDHDPSAPSKEGAVTKVEGDSHPAQTKLYIEPNSSDQTFAMMMKQRAQPCRVEIGAKGIPNYLFPRPGGRGFYKVHNLQTFID